MTYFKCNVTCFFLFNNNLYLIHIHRIIDLVSHTFYNSHYSKLSIAALVNLVQHHSAIRDYIRH